jgi:hypothetical protein
MQTKKTQANYNSAKATVSGNGNVVCFYYYSKNFARLNTIVAHERQNEGGGSS